jgi:O-antigen ligase
MSAVRTRLAHIADRLAIAIAVSLPWSTTATVLLFSLWFLTLLPTIDLNDVRREIATPAGGLPVTLFVLAVLGMAWADVSWAERLGGLDSFFKLLMIPLLSIQFRRSDRGIGVVAGYLASCTALLIVSSAFALSSRDGSMLGVEVTVPVKSASTQIGEFVTCVFALLFIAIEIFRRGDRLRAAGVLVLILVFLANIFYIAVVPTALPVTFTILVIVPFLLVLLGFKTVNARTMQALLAIVVAVAAVSLISSPSLQNRIATIWKNVQPIPGDDQNWAGSRPEFWKKSLNFIEQAPILGHGTGSMGRLFVQSTVGQTGHAARMTTHPHQQTFAVGIQLGLIGICLLWAMWISHLMLFRGKTLPDWIGLVVVTQGVLGSLVTSNLFDFTEGWTYAFGVGTVGGMVCRLRAVEATRGRNGLA